MSESAAERRGAPSDTLVRVSRPLTDRERAVLDAMLSVDFDGVQRLRVEAKDAVVVGGCECGCPSVDFFREPGIGMHILANAQVHESMDGLFLYAVGGRLGGIEWVGGYDGSYPSELPEPTSLVVHPA